MTEIIEKKNQKYYLNDFKEAHSFPIEFLLACFTFLLRLSNSFFFPESFKKLGKIFELHVLGGVSKSFLRIVTSKLSKGFFPYLRYRIYMNLRAKKIAENVELFDSFISMHPAIDLSMLKVFQKSSLTILPKLPYLDNESFELRNFKPKSCSQIWKLFSTGAQTKYRMQTVKLLRKKFEKENVKIKIDSVGFVDDASMNKECDFTLNIPQSAVWPISSPMRIYRSLKLNIVPILYKSFNDHPIESCSISIEEFFTIFDDLKFKQLIETINGKVEKYNQGVDMQEHKLIQQMCLPDVKIINETNSLEYFKHLDYINWRSQRKDQISISEFFSEKISMF